MVKLNAMPAGSVIKFAGRDWILLDPTTGYIFSKNAVTSRYWDTRTDVTPIFNTNPLYSNNIGNYLNYNEALADNYFKTLTLEQKQMIVPRVWNIGNETNESASRITADIGLISYSEAIKYKDLINYNTNEVWTITIKSGYTANAFYIDRNGYVGNHSPVNYSYAVHPTLTLNPTLSVINGTVVNNVAPTQPGSFIKPTNNPLMIGSKEDISWGASTDVDGNLAKYILEASVNGETFTQISTPTTNSFTYTIPTATSIQFRVKAQDSEGLESSYSTSNSYTVKKPNQAPTVLLTSPSENMTLYENDTLNIAGTAYDADTDQSVTVYYQINSEQRKVLATNMSQTQITLSKQLKFKAGKLYDVDTAITGNLSDGIAHKLKVWAVDSENASSTIIERQFYAVPNRAPMLTVNPPTPSGIIDSDSFGINGTFEDLDKNETTVSYRINGANSVQIANGTSGTFEFNVSLGVLKVGENVITVEAIDSYGAKTTQTVKLRKNKVAVPITKSTARYKITPPTGTASEILVWVQHDAELTLKASASMTLAGEQESFKPMTLTTSANLQNGQVEDEFYLSAGEAKDSIVLQLELEKSDVNVDSAITLIMGVL